MSSYHCKICGKPLSDFTSIKLGIGPVCRNRQKQQTCLDFFHATFVVLEIKYNYILIKDTGHKDHITVTNDVDYVLAELAKEYDIHFRRIFYIDSDGRTDEILHDNTCFRGFCCGHNEAVF